MLPHTIRSKTDGQSIFCELNQKRRSNGRTLSSWHHQKLNPTFNDEESDSFQQVSNEIV